MRIRRAIHVLWLIVFTAMLVFACGSPTGSEEQNQNTNENAENEQEENGQSESQLELSTNDADDVGRHSATLNGMLDEMGELETVDVGFQYGKADVSDWSDDSEVSETPLQALDNAVSFEQEIDDLQGGADGSTEYEFRAVAYDADENIVAGDTRSFTTAGPGHADTVEALTVDGDYLYTGSADETVHKVDISGEEPQRVWMYDGHSSEISDIAVHSNTGSIYTAAGSEIHILDPAGESPDVVNIYDEPTNTITELAFDDDELYIAYGGFDVLKVNAAEDEDLEKDWEHAPSPAGEPGPQALAVDPVNDAIYSGTSRGVLYRTDNTDGEPESTELDHDVDFEDHPIHALVALEEGNDTVLIAGSGDGYVRKFTDVVSGSEPSEEWNAGSGDNLDDVNDLVADGGGNIVTGSDGTTGSVGLVRKLAVTNGEQDWTYGDHDYWVTAVAIDDDGDVYSGSADEAESDVHKIDADTGEQVWSYH